MRNISLRVLALFMALSIPAAMSAHSGKARFHVIIDTDGAADDLRTICMLLGNREVEVLAITASEGALPPAETAKKACALLSEFHHEGIPAGSGRAVGAPAPRWREISGRTVWSKKTPACDTVDAARLIAEVLDGEPEKVTVMALGSLTNIHDALVRTPHIADRIQSIIWYDSNTVPLSGINYRTDSTAARSVLSSGIPVTIISEDPGRSLAADTAWIGSISAIAGPYAAKIAHTHSRPPLKRLSENGHLRIWDELTAVYLFEPDAFSIYEVSPSVRICTPAADVTASRLQDIMLSILRGKPDGESRVFYGFPVSGNLYSDDVASILDSTLARHGASEWRAAVLTNELHGHLGIYATIGVKMGIRAREFFNIGVDDIHVTSYAGSTPPVSCLNDGLQVGTGGTVGHGLIIVADVKHPRPEAEFKFKDRTLRLRLKEQYARRIRDDVRHGVELYGTSSPKYWQYIRELALRYWAEFDRHEIFDMTAE